ncbi:hypothetical protein A2U01_0075979, partial [Trifolium medium]|nr:hypothetical protein [Trifolium medium]
MDVVLEQVETPVSNKPLQDQQSASLAPSNRSEPAGSSNSSPNSDADQEMASCDAFINALSTID